VKVLGIDTATMNSGIGVVEKGQVLADFRYDVKLTHSEVLLSFIDRLLRDLNLKLEDIDGFSISIGPGSFTGLRIGLATVKGLAFSSGKPVVGVPTLDALAFLSRGCRYPVVPIIDAKKYQIYAAVYHTQDNKIERKTPYLVMDLEDLIKKLPEEVVFTGPKIEIFRSQLKKAMGKKAHFISGEKTLPSGAAVAYLGWQKLKENKKEDLSSLVPIYVRKSEAELKYRNV
jgi:tRNA threonylcarbamoyladenosine biosynthesis protein TsaB